jgi:hypothetical protein
MCEEDVFSRPCRLFLPNGLSTLLRRTREESSTVRKFLNRKELRGEICPREELSGGSSGELSSWTTEVPGIPSEAFEKGD